MEGEDMLSINVSSHLVQVYDTGNTSTRLRTISIGSNLPLAWERVTHPCPAESKMSGQEAEESQASVQFQVRPDSQTSKLSQLETRQKAAEPELSQEVPDIRQDQGDTSLGPAREPTEV